MSDSGDRSHAPFLLLLVIILLIMAVGILGPDFISQRVPLLPGSLNEPIRSGSIDIFSPITNGLNAFSQAVANLFAGFSR
jgi:CBS domain containing-hemolysin-like protein